MPGLFLSVNGTNLLYRWNTAAGYLAAVSIIAELTGGGALSAERLLHRQVLKHCSLARVPRLR